MLKLVSILHTEGADLSFQRLADLEKLVSPLPTAEVKAKNRVEISGLSYDSRNVSEGDLFTCIRGFKTDGHMYAGEAVAKGARALLVERWLSEDVPQVKVDDSRLASAIVAASFFGKPSQQLQLVGITGTNGKTTVAYLLEAIFRTAGLKSGLLGTITGRIGAADLPLEHTTPEAIDSQRIFRKMVDEGVQAVAMEVSSQGIHLNRVTGSDFNVLVFTNLSPEHLDYHQTMEGYFDAKSSLFISAEAAAAAVINIDDPYGRQLQAKVGQRQQYTYGLDEAASIRALDVETDDTGTRFVLATAVGQARVALKLNGRFNVSNALGASGAALALGLPLDAVKDGLETVRVVPGRFELVDEGQGFTVIVDYAHTPDSLGNLLGAAKELCQNRLITIFGCGGGRDRSKRALMGEIAAQQSDYVYLTSDNPRSEDPEAIISEIKVGLTRHPSIAYEVILDRRQAIFAAMDEARGGDFIVIAGKGHEQVQIFKDRETAFDDRSVAREALSALKGVGV